MAVDEWTGQLFQEVFKVNDATERAVCLFKGQCKGLSSRNEQWERRIGGGNLFIQVSFPCS